MISRPFFSLFSILFFFLFLQNASAEQQSETQSAVERLELKQHERLLRVKMETDAVLQPFTSDGCSGWLSSSWQFFAEKISYIEEVHGEKPPWEACCVTHDRAYHSGGNFQASPQQGYEERKQADLALKDCVLQTGKERIPELIQYYEISESELNILYNTVAELMYSAVRVGGLPCTGLPWRWGYGWPDCKGYLE